MGPGAPTLIIALSILYAPGFARVAYAEALGPRARFRDRPAGARRGADAHPRPHGAAQRRTAAGRAVLADRRRRAGARERPVVPRPGRRAADTVLGPDDPRRA